MAQLWSLGVRATLFDFMKDPINEIKRLDRVIIGLNAWILDLAYTQVAGQRVMKEIFPTLTKEQQRIVSRFQTYKKEMKEEALIKIEDLSPRRAALLDSVLTAKKRPKDES